MNLKFDSTAVKVYVAENTRVGIYKREPLFIKRKELVMKKIAILAVCILFLSCASAGSPMKIWQADDISIYSSSDLIKTYHHVWTSQELKKHIAVELDSRQVTIPKRKTPKSDQYVYIGNGEYKWSWLLEE